MQLYAPYKHYMTVRFLFTAIHLKYVWEDNTAIFFTVQYRYRSLIWVGAVGISTVFLVFFYWIVTAHRQFTQFNLVNLQLRNLKNMLI